jgi:KaiC/GvpD/RAD55 family RecA-like ATPase
MYDFAGVLDVEIATAIPPGSSILIAGPAMTGKQDLLLDVLAAGVRDGEGAVVVTTNDRAEALIEDLQSRAPGSAGHQLGAIDCRADGSREQVELDSGACVHRVASPSDLTGIGISITKCFERLHDVGLDDGRLALSSLSTMLTYTDQQTVFKFCHVLSSRLDSSGYLGLFTIDSSAHDEQTMQVIKQAFDGLVEIRETDGIREARVMGLEPDPSEWVEL